MELKPDIVERLNDWEAKLREPFPFDENDSELARQWKERQQSKADMARDAAAEIKRLRALSSPRPEDGEAARNLAHSVLGCAALRGIQLERAIDRTIEKARALLALSKQSEG